MLNGGSQQGLCIIVAYAKQEGSALESCMRQKRGVDRLNLAARLLRTSDCKLRTRHPKQERNRLDMKIGCPVCDAECLGVAKIARDSCFLNDS